MGTIMAVVAVLLIHMDRKAVTPMKPSINLGQQDEETVFSLRYTNAKVCAFILKGHVSSQGGPDSDQQQDSEGDSLVEVPVLHGHGHHQPPHKQHVGVLQVLHTHLHNNTHNLIEELLEEVFKEFSYLFFIYPSLHLVILTFWRGK